MIIRVHLESDEPLYQQIRSQIVAGIASGELESGEQLPSVRKLGEELGINLHTVNKAYALLKKEGYVSIEGRAGVRVLDPGGTATEKRQRRAFESIERLITKAAHEAKAWGMSRDEFLEHARSAFAVLEGDTK